MCKGCPGIRYDDRRQPAEKRTTTGAGKIGLESRWAKIGKTACIIGKGERNWAENVNSRKKITQKKAHKRLC
jgi:hypothetical protein